MSIKSKIKSIYRDCSKTEQTIADYILNNTKAVSKMTINEISSSLNIADSTVFQFTKKLGYKGFRDFRNDLLTEEFDPEISVHENIKKEDSPLTIAQKVFSSTTQSLKSTLDILSEEAITKAATLILDCDTLHLFGTGGSNIVCYDAYHKFLRSPVHVQYIEDFHMQLMNAALSGPGDCAIIVSHSGLTKQMIMIAEELKKNKVKIILITSYLICELSRYADVVLVSMADETQYRTESLSSRISQLALIDTLFTITMFRKEKETNTVLHKIRETINQTKE